MEYIERNGKKYPYPVDENGNKMLHPDHPAIKGMEDMIKEMCVPQGVFGRENPFIVKTDGKD